MRTRAACAAAVLILGAISTTTVLGEGQYKSFKVSIYCPVGATRQMSDPQWLADNWARVSGQVKIDKVYIETFRSGQWADERTIEPIKKFFTDKGVEVAGGVTLVANDSGQFQTFDYAKPEDRETVKQVMEVTAKHFNEIILDDFFFYCTKSDADIAAKGDKSWTQYRLETMRDVAANWVVKPAKDANPQVHVIVKFPNWYEHFAGLGFDLDQEPKIFDGIYTGTETRDPVHTEQHLQPYESYQIIRYFSNIAPGRNGGGWVDGYDVPYVDRYAEQLWDTVFAKAPQMMLFNFQQIQQPVRPGAREAWADQATSFNYDAMIKSNTGPGPVTMARVAGYALEQADAVVGKLGKPVGVASYRPPYALGEDFLHNYLGMIGIPMEVSPTFPTDAQTVLLTEAAKADPDIVAKMEGQLKAGKNVVITSGLVRALGGKIGDICELEDTGRKILATEFIGQGGRPLGGKIDGAPIVLPQVNFLTNDAWALVQGMAEGDGVPVLLSDRYSKGMLYVLTIPDNFNDLYRLPPEVLAAVRSAVMREMPVTVSAPGGVSVFEYDNGTFVVESFLPGATGVTIGVNGRATGLTNLASGEAVAPQPAGRGRGGRGGNGGGGARTNFAVTVPAHSWMAFSVTP